MSIVNYPDRAAWLLARRGGIGGSDASVILGNSRWRTPLQLWMSKVGLDVEAEEPPDVQLRIGQLAEPMIAQLFMEDTGLAVDRREHVIVWSDAAEGLFCSPDGFVNDGGLGVGPCLFEAKTADTSKADDWANGVPDYYVSQVQHSLFVTRLERAYVAVLIGTRDFKWAKVERDPAYWDTNKDALLDFLRRVREQDPPAAGGGDKEALGRLYPRETGEVKPLTGQALDWSWELDEIARNRGVLETREDELQNRIREQLGDASRGVLADGSGWSWSTQERVAMVPDPAAPKRAFRVLRRFGRKKESA